MSRDRNTQAVYALKGKPLNSWECDQTKVFSNSELSDLTCAIGTGLFTDQMTPEEIETAMSKLRYDKIVTMADADIDGSHIECLLLGHLFRHARPLIERGHVYIALPPLYRVTEKGKHSFLKDEATLAAFFRKRAKAVVGDDAALLALAGYASQVKLAVETIAGSAGLMAGDVAHAFQAIVSYEDTREDWLRAFAEKIVELRGTTCEGVDAQETASGAVVVSGLEQSGRFFTTVIDETFYEAVTRAWDALADLITQDHLISLAQSSGAIINDTACGDVYKMACEIEKASRKGVSVQRNKGLGEMQAEDLGETTLDRATRRLIRVVVDDFDAAGEFVGSMLSASTVDARREVVRNVQLDREMVDA
jgi:DNA gyrase subunit B